MKRVKSTLIVAGVLSLFVYLCGIGIKNYFRYNEFKTEYDALLRIRTEEQARNKSYRIKLARLRQGDAEWEFLIKKRLGMIHKGEIVYKIVD